MPPTPPASPTSPLASSRRSTPGGGPTTTSPSGRSTSRPTRCCGRPLTSEQIKPRLLGHWGTSPGLSFVYAHASRLIQHTGQQMIYLAGPGHGGPALVAASYLEGTYTERFPEVTTDADGMRLLFRRFSAPGGIPSHVSVTTPGSIHEGGELGYVLDARVRCRAGQPRPDRARRRGRRRGRDRTAGGLVEGRLVPQSRARRRGAAGAPSQRRQDRRAHRAGPQGPCRGALAARGPRLRRARGGGVGPAGHARALRGDARDGVPPDPGDPARRPHRQLGRPSPPLAADRASLPQGLDRSTLRGRCRDRGDLALPPGAALGSPGQPRAPGDPRGVDAVLPPRGALRRPRATRRPGAGGQPRRRGAHVGQPARQRRPASPAISTSPTSAPTPSTCRHRRPCAPSRPASWAS